MVLEEPIKEVGLYEVPLRLTHNVVATLMLEVVAEDAPEEERVEPPVGEEEAPKAKAKSKAKKGKRRTKREETPQAAAKQSPRVLVAQEEPPPVREPHSHPPAWRFDMSTTSVAFT
jgi:hypothetical protein